MNDSTGSVGYADFRIQKYRNTAVPGGKEDRMGFILLTPEATIKRYVQEVRADTYDMLRSPSDFSADFSDLRVNLPNLTMSTLRIEQGSLACGKTLADLNIRKQYSVSILAVKRQQHVIENPSGVMDFQPGDEAIVMGPLKKSKILQNCSAPQTRQIIPEIRCPLQIDLGISLKDYFWS